MSNPPPPVRVILFDLDGTLLNTEDIYTEIYNDVLAAHCTASPPPELPWHIKAQQQSRGIEV